LATAVLAIAIYHFQGPVWLSIILALCALLMILYGAFGRKVRVDRALGRIADEAAASILDGIVDAVIESF
jgi:hypothetical protein